MTVGEKGFGDFRPRHYLEYTLENSSFCKKGKVFCPVDMVKLTWATYSDFFYAICFENKEKQIYFYIANHA